MFLNIKKKSDVNLLMQEFRDQIRDEVRDEIQKQIKQQFE